MREMKNSGIDWIGDIPTSWKTERLGYYSHMLVPMRDKPTRFDGDIPWIRIEDFDGMYIEKSKTNQNVSLELINEMNMKIYPKGTVLCSCSCNLGTCAITTVEMCSNQTFIGVVPNKKLNNRFLYYVLSSSEKRLNALSQGTIQSYLSQDNFSKLKIAMCNIDEQVAIADYLDKKCADIDKIISAKRKTNELLKERRQSIITEAVTKGLNPNAEMKDSGIDWIGKIPKHWDVTKAKYVFQDGDGSLKTGPFGSALKGKTLDYGEYKIYNQAHLISDDFLLNRHFISSETFESLKSYEILPGDILFTMMGTIGKCKVMPSGYPKGILDSHLLKARLNDLMIPEFFSYIYDKDNSSLGITQLKCYSNGSIMDGLNSTIIKNICLTLPSVGEQKEIVCYLDEKCKEIDELIESNNKTIEKLQEYRKSLIYEAVTGKIEVC